MLATLLSCLFKRDRLTACLFALVLFALVLTRLLVNSLPRLILLACSLDCFWYRRECSYWLEKTTHVHAVYPANCTDDLLFIEENNCTALLWPTVIPDNGGSPLEKLT